MTESLTILYVVPEYDEHVLDTLRTTLENSTLVTEHSIVQAEAKLLEHEVDCLVTEYDLPDGTGLELIDRVDKTQPDATCILFTSVNRETIDTAAFGTALTEYLDRDAPNAADRLADLIRMTTDLRSHTAYPLPDNEPARLDALAGITPESDGLATAVDRLTQLAAMHFDVPISSVNLITDHRQEFLSCHGADWDSTAREDSICTYAILDDDLTVIEDIHEDLRFADNEAIRELDLRFYAGAPLRLGDGAPVGTLCIYDHEPRTLDREGRDYLRLLADEVVDQLMLRGRSAPGHPDSVPRKEGEQ